MKKLLLLLYLVLINITIGQNSKYDLSEILSSFDDDNLNEYTLNLLEEIYNNKLDLNTLDFADKNKLFFIDEYLLNKIVNNRIQNGNYKSFSDLYKLADVNPNELNKLLPFVKIDLINKIDTKIDLSPNIISRIRFLSKNNFEIPDKYYSRFVVLSNYYKFYSILDNTSQNTPQLKNISLSISPNLVLKKIIIGEYNINFGFGLALWGPYKLFKGRYFRSIGKNNSRLKKHSSADIKNSLSGAGVTFNYNKISSTLFYSKKRIRDNLFNSDNKIDRQHFGCIIKYINEKSEIEFLLQNYKFSSLGKKIKSFLNFGLTSKFTFNNYSYENEVNLNSNHLSQVHTFKYQSTKYLTIFYLIRNYNNLFQFGYANPIRESSTIRNEFGQMFCLEYRFNKTKYLLYIDKYNLSSKLNKNIVLSGIEYIGVVSHKFDKGLELISNVKYENKEKIINGKESIMIGRLANILFRVEMKSEITNHFNLHQRLDITRILNSKSKYSYSISSRINYTIPKILNLIIGVAYFNIPDDNMPVYLYEYDLPGLFTNRRLNGDGFSWYCLTKLKLFNSLVLSIKYSQYTRKNQFQINYYSNQITDLKVQLDLKI